MAEVERELVRRRADLVEHARGSLAQHLHGVRRVLAAWGQPERVQLAGFLHSGYSTESFAYRLFGPRDRGRVRELIGADAERLVFAFCGVRRELLVEVAQGDAAEAKLATRWDGVTVTLRSRELGELLILHAANLAEQTCRSRGGPAPWLALASECLALAQSRIEVVPFPFGARTNRITRDDETALLAGYAQLLPKRGSPIDDPLAHEDAVMPEAPVGEPLVIAGLAALAARRAGKAARLARRARAAFESMGVAWDKRLRIDRWQSLAELLVRTGDLRDRELDHAARRAAVVLERARGAPERIWAQLDAEGAFDSFGGEPSRASASEAALPQPAPPTGSLPTRFAEYIAGLRGNHERPILPFYPGLRTLPWHDPREHPIVHDLVRHASAIASEARALETVRFQDEAEEIGRTGRWSVLFLHELGRRNEENLARCPVTASILEKHRTITTSTGLVYFSCLDPRTRIAPHQGPTNMRLRCHLGLEIPEGCGMRVGGVTGTWREGECVVFDDSFWHEVWNDSDERRVVLIIDLWHPDLSDDEVALLSGLQRYGMKNASSTERGLARNDVARERARQAAVSAATPPLLARRRN